MKERTDDEFPAESGSEKKRKKKNGGNLRRAVTAVLTVLMLTGLTGYGIYWNRKAEKQAEKTRFSYERAFSDLLGYLEDTEGYLLKAMASGTPARTSLMLEEAWRSAALAENSLSALPIDRNVMTEVSKYLVQVGDVVKSYNAKTVGGSAMTEADAETLQALYGYAQDLSGAFSYMAYRIGQQDCTWEEIEQYSAAIPDQEQIRTKYAFLENFSTPFTDYPALIYDGPFSEHMKSREARALAGQEDVSPDQGTALLCCVFSDYTIESIRLQGESTDGVIGTYRYLIRVRDDGPGGSGSGVSSGETGERREDTLITAYADVTRKGGMLYSMVFYRTPGEPNLSPEQAVEAGRRYLERIGYEDMAPSYYEIGGGYVTANYCTEKDGVRYYPDMVKVSIALDSGEIVGLEGERYIRNHTEREAAGGILSEKEARETVGRQLTVLSARRAVIPNDFGGEYDTYEFICDLAGRRVLVYVDSVTGEEREIMILQEDENGVLAK